MNLITLSEAKAQLQMDHNDDDALIQTLVPAASGAVLNYLKGSPIGKPERDDQGRIVKDSSGDIVYEYDTSGLIIRDEIKHAVKLLIGYMYRLRDDNEGQAYEQGYLPRPVTALLYPLRDPALA